jgi:hypothetical protein
MSVSTTVSKADGGGVLYSVDMDKAMKSRSERMVRALTTSEFSMSQGVLDAMAR